jgi:hypothetical protein
MSAIGLRRFAQQAALPATAGQSAPSARAVPDDPDQAAERCEMCATPVGAEHSHVADLEHSSLACACRACYLLFTGGAQTRYKAVPDRYLADADRVMSPAAWDLLEIPVALAFFLRTSRDGALAGFYPGPAGVTQCQLDLGRWDQLVAQYPLLGEPEADVEAALLSRAAEMNGGVEYYVVPIDACYELAGRMRRAWKGFDGGAEARDSVAGFLSGVRQRAQPYHRQPADA